MANKPENKIIVVGGGLSGLMATLKICEGGGKVDLFSYCPVKRSHSLCAQGGSVGFGHEDPSRNGLQYRNFSHPAGNLCGDKKKYLTPARPWRILLVL